MHSKIYFIQNHHIKETWKTNCLLDEKYAIPFDLKVTQIHLVGCEPMKTWQIL
jgi:hypothetical protein